MEHVFFKPWVGRNYENGGIFNKKLLVLGESHYCGGCNQGGLKYGKECEGFTKDTVINYLNGVKGEWTRTYRKFERSLVNEYTTNERSKEIWNSLAFFNFLQVDMVIPRKGGIPEEYEEGRVAFLEVLNELQPDLVIVWGINRLYENLPGKECGWMDGAEFKVDNHSIPNGYYQLNSGKKTKVIAVYHPSSRYSWDLWYKAISVELQLK